MFVILHFQVCSNRHLHQRETETVILFLQTSNKIPTNNRMFWVEILRFANSITFPSECLLCLRCLFSLVLSLFAWCKGLKQCRIIQCRPNTFVISIYTFLVRQTCKNVNGQLTNEPCSAAAHWVMQINKRIYRFIRLSVHNVQLNTMYRLSSI